LRFFAVAFLGRTYGQEVAAFFSRHYQPIVYVLIALVFTGGIGFLIYFALRRRTAEKKN
jgi:Trk-type K+ transport system membrane component